MSNHLISLVYKLDIGSLLRKSVLVLLADKASDDGSGIWASKQTMADELCCSKQAILKTLQEFMAEGLLVEIGRKQHRNGYTITYGLRLEALDALPRVKRWADNTPTALTGQRDEPVNCKPATSQPRLPKPSLPPKQAKACYLKGVGLPEGFPVEPYMALVRARKALPKVSFTEDAARGIVRKCLKLEADGYDIAKLLWKAVDHGWRTVFPNEDCKPVAANANRPLTNDELQSAIRYRRDIGDEAMAVEYEAELKKRLAA